MNALKGDEFSRAITSTQQVSVRKSSKHCKDSIFEIRRRCCSGRKDESHEDADSHEIPFISPSHKPVFAHDRVKENVDRISLSAVHATPETLTHDTEHPVQLQDHVMLHFPKRPHKSKSPDLRLKVETMSTSSHVEDNHNVLRDEKGHDHDYITFANSPSHSHTRDSRDRMEVPDRNVKRSTELSKVSESLHVHSLNGHRGDEISTTPSVPSKVKRRMRWELDVRLFSLSLSLSEKCHQEQQQQQQVSHTKQIDHNVQDAHDKFIHDEIEDPEHVSYMNLPSHSHHRKIQDKLHKRDEMKFTTFEKDMNTMSSDEEHEHHEMSHPSPSHVVRNREKKLSHHKNITFLKMEEKEHKIDSVAHHHHPRDPHQIPRISPVHTISPTHVKVKHTSHALPGKDVADPHDMVLGDAAVEHDRISFAHSPSFFVNDKK